jgi:hypothetical protein
MVHLTFESEIRGVETIRPDIAGNFVSPLSPNAFLFVESGLVRREILEMNPRMALKKELDCLAFVPVGAINIEMDGIASQRSEHMLKDLEEPVPVALCCAYESLPPQQGRHPAGQVEPFSVLAGSGDFEPLALLGPTSPEAGMKTEASFILKDNRFISFESAEFFLTPGENRLHPWPEPGDKHSRPVSNCNPSGVTSIGPAVPSNALRNPSSGESLASARPRQLAAGQTPGASFPDLAAVAASARMSVDSDALAAAWAVEPESHPGLHHVSSAPESYDLDPTKRLPVPEAGPPKPTTERRSLIPPMRPELASPVPVAFPWLPRGASESRLS